MLAGDPDDVEAMLLLGLALGLAGEAEQAAPLLVRVAAARPLHAHPCGDLAGLLRRADRRTEAHAQFRAAARLAPADARLAFAHAAFLHSEGRLADAAARLGTAASAAARNLLGIVRAEQGRTGEAIAAFREVLAAEPGNVGARTNLGAACAAEARMDEAIAAYEAALPLAPENIAIRLGRAYALLKAGRLAEGFAEHEWRLRLPGRALLPPSRRLAPKAALAGQTILLTQDEGMGDTLMMLRYVPLLARAGARVLTWVPPELVRIARAIPGLASVFSGDTAAPACDWHAPFLSLPYVFGTTLETIPPPVPVILDADLVSRWAARLPACAGRRVGLCWAGAARRDNPAALAIDRRRSLPLSALAALGGVPGVQFVSLQAGPPAAQIANAPFSLHDPMPDVADFADTAAIVANVDVVVSADTAVAHLAASMNKCVLLLDRFDNCWRWLTGRDDCPWYPSLRIVRQHRSGDWPGVAARVRTMLAVT